MVTGMQCPYMHGCEVAIKKSKECDEKNMERFPIFGGMCWYSTDCPVPIYIARNPEIIELEKKLDALMKKIPKPEYVR